MPNDPVLSPPPATAGPSRFLRSDLWASVTLFLLLTFVFVSSPVTYVTDSQFCLLLSESLLSKGSFVLDGYGIPHNPPGKNNDADVDGDLYQIEVIHGHFFYYFPPGSSILSMPFVALTDHLGRPIVDKNGAYDFANEVRVQAWLAALLMAGLGVIFYRTARLLLPMAWSLCLALGASLGTQIWSTASRGLWTHTWGTLLLGWIVYALLACETGRRRLSPVWLASVLSWTYFIRPTNAIFIVGVTVYVGLYHRKIFVAYAVTGAAWFVGFVAWSHHEFGQWLPSYYRASRLGAGHFAEAFTGNLVSASRGLLVLVPVTGFVLYLLVRYWRGLPHRRLLGMLLIVGLAQLTAVAGFDPWNGGGCFGPRYSTELVPALLLAAVLGVAAVRRAAGGWNLPLSGVGALLLLLSAWINGRAATVPATLEWNARPVNIDVAPARVWDWTYPQALAGILPMPRPAVWPKLEGRLRFGLHTRAIDFQGDGWGNGDDDFCWTDGARADLFFATDDLGANRLRLDLLPFVAAPYVTQQRVKIALNGHRVGSFVLKDGQETECRCVLPPGVLQAQNTVTLQLPDAASPYSVDHRVNDIRRLGVRVYWMELGTAAGGSHR